MNTPLEKLKKEASLIRMSQTEKDAMRTRITDAMRISAVRANLPVKSTYMWYSWRMVGTFAVLVVVVLGTGTTYAAGNALPGSPLYAIKVGVNEPVKEALAFSNEAKIKFHTETAEVRLEEAETLASEGRLDGEASALIAANLTEHVEQAQTIARAIEVEDPAAAMEVSMQFDSSLAAHSEVLAQLGDSSDDESTKVNSITIAQSASGQDVRGGVTGVMAMMKATLPTTADIRVATLSVEVASDSPVENESTTTVEPTPTTLAAPANDSSSDEKATNQLKLKVEGRLQAVRIQFTALQKRLTATTTAAVEARIKTLEDQFAAGENAQKTADYSGAKADYTEVLKGTIELSTFLSASKKFDKGLLDSLLSKYNFDVSGEVKGVMDAVIEGEVEKIDSDAVKGVLKATIGL